MDRDRRRWPDPAELAAVGAEHLDRRGDEAPVAEPLAGALDARVGERLPQPRGVVGELVGAVQRLAAQRVLVVDVRRADRMAGARRSRPTSATCQRSIRSSIGRPVMTATSGRRALVRRRGLGVQAPRDPPRAAGEPAGLDGARGSRAPSPSGRARGRSRSRTARRRSRAPSPAPRRIAVPTPGVEDHRDARSLAIRRRCCRGCGCPCPRRSASRAA